MQSTLRTKPAPREIHTENLSVLRPASLGSTACFHLDKSWLVMRRFRRIVFNSPSIGKDTPVKRPEKKVIEQFARYKLLLY